MFEQDYIMRQIKQIINFLLKVLFKINTENFSLQSIKTIEAREAAGDLLRKTDQGNINEAENELSELIENRTMDNLLVGIVFYSYLNEKDDDYLEANDFSRKAVENGMKYLLSEYGLEEMTNLFFYD